MQRKVTGITRIDAGELHTFGEVFIEQHLTSFPGGDHMSIALRTFEVVDLLMTR